MKEEELKKIISKSTVETSDDFINNLMNAIEVKEQAKSNLTWSLRIVLLTCFTLITLVLWVLPKVIDYNLFDMFSSEIPKTPLFLTITFVFLYYVNSIVRLNYHNSKQ